MPLLLKTHTKKPWYVTWACDMEVTNSNYHYRAGSCRGWAGRASTALVDIHHSQMAQSVVAHMQTVLCLDVAHQTERSLNMASRAWSSDKENTNATQRREIVFFGCTQVQLVLAAGR